MTLPRLERLSLLMTGALTLVLTYFVVAFTSETSVHMTVNNSNSVTPYLVDRLLSNRE